MWSGGTGFHLLWYKFRMYSSWEKKIEAYKGTFDFGDRKHVSPNDERPFMQKKKQLNCNIFSPPNQPSYHCLSSVLFLHRYCNDMVLFYMTMSICLFL